MTWMRLLPLFIVFAMLSCNGEKKKDDAGSVSLKGKEYLCFRDEKANKFYFGAKLEDGRFVYTDIPYDTKEDCEKTIAEGSKYINK